MRVIFRVDASTRIGTGHVMRCLALADELRAQGDTVSFVMRRQNGDLVGHTRSCGFLVHEMPIIVESEFPVDSSSYDAWLQVSEKEDAASFLSTFHEAEVVIVDHYGIGITWEGIVKSESRCFLVAIDDLIRMHCADVVIDSTLNRESIDYEAVASDSTILAGVTYALMRRRFSQLHLRALRLVRQIPTKKLLLSMGGVDYQNATLGVLQALSRREKKIDTTVLLSTRSPHYDAVKSFCEKRSEWVTHISFCKEMADLMFEHTIAIGAAGSTSWERASLGLPSVLITLVENQREISLALELEGAVVGLSMHEITSRLDEKLGIVIDNYEYMRAVNLKLVDGKGCQRVVRFLNHLVGC
jgi:UDP-2,4-diacetamido-2,4,6-trideoxy-beta-L-altropyranose hydrolase